jgi:hypothetical protein
MKFCVELGQMARETYEMIEPAFEEECRSSSGTFDSFA